jgi:hypothetical protein
MKQNDLIDDKDITRVDIMTECRECGRLYDELNDEKICHNCEVDEMEK